jgi:prepilin-type N-terminal cleavage/methylation domain-containing protein
MKLNPLFLNRPWFVVPPSGGHGVSEPAEAGTTNGPGFPDVAARSLESSGPARIQAFTLVEMLVSMGLGSILLAMVASMTLFCGRSIAAMANYSELETQSRSALDLMTSEIRQTTSLSSFTATDMTFLYTNNFSLRYYYDQANKQLVRTCDGVSKTLLKECDYVHFSIFQRNLTNQTFNCVSTTNLANCKLVQINWVCSRTIIGAKLNTESVQSAKVVIRNK